jgi:RimJ/RimL family protein N-acetyltransferase
MNAMAPGHTIRLSDGRQVPYRPIEPADAVRLQAFHQRLSDRSRFQRFFRHYPVLGDAQAEWFANVDGHNRLAIVALDPDDLDVIVGVVRLDRDGTSDTAEYAAVVTDAWQGLGLGHELTLILLDAAREESIRKVYALVLPGNQPMLALLKGLGQAWRVSIDEGFERVEIELAEPL